MVQQQNNATTLDQKERALFVAQLLAGTLPLAGRGNWKQEMAGVAPESIWVG